MSDPIVFRFKSDESDLRFVLFDNGSWALEQIRSSDALGVPQWHDAEHDLDAVIVDLVRAALDYNKPVEVTFTQTESPAEVLQRLGEAALADGLKVSPESGARPSAETLSRQLLERNLRLANALGLQSDHGPFPFESILRSARELKATVDSANFALHDIGWSGRGIGDSIRELNDCVLSRDSLIEIHWSARHGLRDELQSVREELDMVRAQRDEMLAACRRFATIAELDAGTVGD